MRTALLCLLVAVGIVSAATAKSADAAAASPATVAETEYTLAVSTATPLQRARDALAAAAAHLTRREYTKALASLKTLRYKLWRAHNAAMALIGKPPTDPESDEPPGPPAVIAVTNLEHRITMVLVPFFNGLKKNWVIDPLGYTLWRTHRLRNAMLNKVIALPAAKGEDYDDSMSDTVPNYKAEVNLVTKALKEYQLNASGRDALTSTLARVRATYAKVNKRWGGGE